jgi:selenocysteine lyase/cysteine desulfurase
LSQVATEKHEQARKKVAEWLNAAAEEVSLQELMKDGDAQKILERSFYKP